MSLPYELQDTVRATHLLVRSAEEWNKLSEKVHEARANGDEQQLDDARMFHVRAWASVARNILTAPFEGNGITITPATTAWGIATLSTGKRSCQPQLTRQEAYNAVVPPRLRDFEEVMTAYNECLSYLVGTTNTLEQSIR